MENKITKGRINYDSYLGNDISLWRYMTFDKFMDFIINKHMWFSRITEFKDKNEGIITEDNIYKYFILNLVNNEMRIKYSDMHDINEIVYLKWGKERYNDIKESIKNVYVNCWNQSDNDSELMWLAYGQDNSLAIKTTSTSIINSLNISNDYINNIFWFDFDKVKYINHKDIKIDGISRVGPAFWKKKRFKDEKEVRLVAYKFDCIENDRYNLVKYLNDDLSEAYGISVDMAELDFKVIINPYADNWFKILIKELSQIHNFKVLSMD